MRTAELTRGSPRRAMGRGWTSRRIWVVVVAMLGVMLLLYPTAASWITDRVHQAEIGGYVGIVATLPTQEQERILQEADSYNQSLPTGPLRDPWVLDGEGRQAVIGDGEAAYAAALSTPGTDIMATVVIPSIGVDLPIRHGTGDDVLTKGVGHLYGSALPVGGEGTHAVLTAHSGFANATLFSDLGNVALEENFSIRVFGQTLTYRVVEINVVLPNETEELRAEAGRDLVTLVTCTPTAVNTHRLLVTGERVPTPGDAGNTTVAAQAIAPEFPWWTLLLLAALGVVIPVSRRLDGRPNPRRAA